MAAEERLSRMDAVRVAKVDDIPCYKNGKTATGTLHLTAHHLIFKTDQDDVDGVWVRQAFELHELITVVHVPYPLVNMCTRLPQGLQGLTPLLMRTRTFEALTLSFRKEADAFNVFETVRELTMAASVTQLYAFAYVPTAPASKNGKDGWEIYNVQEEYMRMGVGKRTKAWRFTDINRDYSFSPTYPSKLVVPARISDSTLTYAGRYRSKARIPILSYLHWSNYGSITRSSQPMVGLTNSRSIQDEKLVESIFQSHLSVGNALTSIPESRSRNQSVYGATATNLIIDARPTANAMVNASNGGGTENMDNYKDAKKVYLGVANIHVMRDSLNKVTEALRDADVITEPADGASTTGLVDREALRRSSWLRHISAILEGTLLIVRNVHINSSHVLIHCSDGWDRTSQMSALAQLCLDPYYRTIRGFQVLIEKDWLSFGHKFLDRCGHLSSERVFQYGSGDDSSQQAQTFLTSVQNRLTGPAHLKEISPVFHQFLESVRQIQRQFPERFEFNERFLERIHYHLYSCQFGTFLFNCERERRISLDGASRWSGMEKTHSAWEWFNMAENKEEWANQPYDSALDDPKKGDMGVLMPNPKDVRFWNELYGRTDEEMNGKVVTGQAVGADVVAVEDLAEDEVLGATMDAVTLEVPPSQSRGTNLRAISPGVLSTSQSRRSTPPIASTSPNPPVRAVPQPVRVESFRPYNTQSAFSLHSSPATPSPAPPSPGLSNSPHVGTTSRKNPNPPTLSSWNTPPSSTPPASQQGAFGFGALRAGLSSASVQSMWGKLSANASAALSAVQDTAKDLQEHFNQPGGAGSGEMVERAGGPSSNKSALGWPMDNPDWGTPTTYSTTSAAVDANRGGPSATMRSMRDPYMANPWAVPAETSNPQRTRRLGDEWQSSPSPQGVLSSGIQPPRPSDPLLASTDPLLAPTPRRASTRPLSLAPEAPPTLAPEPVKPPDGAATAGTLSTGDPLGVGLL